MSLYEELMNGTVRYETIDGQEKITRIPPTSLMLRAARRIKLLESQVELAHHAYNTLIKDHDDLNNRLSKYVSQNQELVPSLNDGDSAGRDHGDSREVASSDGCKGVGDSNSTVPGD